MELIDLARAMYSAFIRDGAEAAPVWDALSERTRYCWYWAAHTAQRVGERRARERPGGWGSTVYVTYGYHAGYVDDLGEPMRRWWELPPEARDRWHAVADRARELLENQDKPADGDTT